MISVPIVMLPASLRRSSVQYASQMNHGMWDHITTLNCKNACTTNSIDIRIAATILKQNAHIV